MPMKSILTQLEERGEVALSRAGKEKGRERGEIQLEMTVLSLSLSLTFCLSHHIRSALASFAHGKWKRLHVNFATSSYRFAGFLSLLHTDLFGSLPLQPSFNCWCHCKAIVQHWFWSSQWPG